MDKSLNKVLLGSSTLLALGATGANAQAATTGVPINAEIVAAISITQTQAMNFGALTDTGAGGTATLGTGGTITGTTGATTSAGGTIQAGGFTVKGATGRNIDITTPASVTIDDAGAGAPMTVHSFAILAPAAGGGGNNTGTTAAGAALVASLTASPAAGFRLGGTLVVGATQLAGTYTGSVTVTALYQ